MGPKKAVSAVLKIGTVPKGQQGSPASSPGAARSQASQSAGVGRPKRSAVPSRFNVEQEPMGMSWAEEADLKRALYASIQGMKGKKRRKKAAAAAQCARSCDRKSTTDDSSDESTISDLPDENIVFGGRGRSAPVARRAHAHRKFAQPSASPDRESGHQQLSPQQQPHRDAARAFPSTPTPVPVFGQEDGPTIYTEDLIAYLCYRKSRRSVNLGSMAAFVDSTSGPNAAPAGSTRSRSLSHGSNRGGGHMQSFRSGSSVGGGGGSSGGARSADRSPSLSLLSSPDASQRLPAKLTTYSGAARPAASSRPADSFVPVAPRQPIGNGRQALAVVAAAAATPMNSASSCQGRGRGVGGGRGELSTAREGEPRRPGKLGVWPGQLSMAPAEMGLAARVLAGAMASQASRAAQQFEDSDVDEDGNEGDNDNEGGDGSSEGGGSLDSQEEKERDDSDDDDGQQNGNDYGGVGGNDGGDCNDAGNDGGDDSDAGNYGGDDSDAGNDGGDDSDAGNDGGDDGRGNGGGDIVPAACPPGRRNGAATGKVSAAVAQEPMMLSVDDEDQPRAVQVGGGARSKISFLSSDEENGREESSGGGNGKPSSTLTRPSSVSQGDAGDDGGKESAPAGGASSALGSVYAIFNSATATEIIAMLRKQYESRNNDGPVQSLRKESLPQEQEPEKKKRRIAGDEADVAVPNFEEEQEETNREEEEQEDTDDPATMLLNRVKCGCESFWDPYIEYSAMIPSPIPAPGIFNLARHLKANSVGSATVQGSETATAAKQQATAAAGKAKQTTALTNTVVLLRDIALDRPVATASHHADPLGSYIFTTLLRGHVRDKFVTSHENYKILRAQVAAYARDELKYRAVIRSANVRDEEVQVSVKRRGRKSTLVPPIAPLPPYKCAVTLYNVYLSVVYASGDLMSTRYASMLGTALAVDPTACLFTLVSDNLLRSICN